MNMSGCFKASEMRRQAMSAENMFSPPVLGVRLDPVAIGAKNLEIVHFLRP
jgi:hypothetical protein